MDTKEFVQNFAEQFDEIETSDFTAETIFRDNEEWSSLTALSVIAMVDEMYDVKLTGDELKACNTIQDVYNVVSNKKA